MASTLRFDNWEDSNGTPIVSGASVPWITEHKGLVQVVPSTATFVTGTGSVNESGTISYTGCTAVELDGVFSADYTNYRLIIRSKKAGSDGDNDIQFQLRSSGSDISGGYHSGLVQYSSSAGSFRNIGSYNRASAVISRVYYETNAAIALDLFTPFDSNNATHWHGTGTGGSAAINEISLIGGETGNDGDGIRLSISGNTITGTIQIYGYTD